MARQLPRHRPLRHAARSSRFETSDPRTVGFVLDKPVGEIRIDDGGKWWISRENLRLDDDGTLTVIVADGESTAWIGGSTAQLRRLAEAIVGQVDGAEHNANANAVKRI